MAIFGINSLDFWGVFQGVPLRIGVSILLMLTKSSKVSHFPEKAILPCRILRRLSGFLVEQIEFGLFPTLFVDKKT